MDMINPEVDEKGTARASVSHELRTPLTSIIGYAEIMLSDPRLSLKARREYAQIIRDEGKRLSSFIDDYLGSTGRSRERTLTTFPQEDVSTLVMSAIAVVRAKVEAKSLNIISQLEPITLSAKLDPTAITHCTENLLTNAISFAPVGSQIHVDVFQDVASIHIQVRSEMKRSPATHAEELEKNYSWTPVPDLEMNEKGLGLAFAKQLVELQGGSLATTIIEEEHLVIMKLEFPNR